jgi:hypothetical protein
MEEVTMIWNKLAEVMALRICVQEVSGLDLDRDIDYPDGVFVFLGSSRQTFQIMPGTFPYLLQERMELYLSFSRVYNAWCSIMHRALLLSSRMMKLNMLTIVRTRGPNFKT